MKAKRCAALAAMLVLSAASACAQTVYINTAGGRYIHTRPDCDTIDEQYASSMLALSEEEAAARGVYRRCGRCMAAQNVQRAGEWCFGGSGRDTVNGLADAGSGRIVMTGATDSCDGTLAGRTKTGHSGWTAMVDAQGNTLWNFCTRYGSRDMMTSPVVHEDGTITVLLHSNGSEFEQIELIRLNDVGGVVSRKPLMTIRDERCGWAPEWPGVFSGGYIVASYDRSISFDNPGGNMPVYQPVYHGFDFDGNPLFETQAPWECSMACVGYAHTIEVIDGTWALCALDEQGKRTMLSTLENARERNRSYTALVSLPDGGAAAVQNWGGTDARLRRWDAQGTLMGEMTLPNLRDCRIRLAGEGLAVIGEQDIENDVVVLLDASGQVLQRQAVGDAHHESLMVMEDGRTAFVQERLSADDVDVCLCLLNP